MKIKIEIIQDEHGHYWVRRPTVHHGSKTYVGARQMAEEMQAELGADNVEIIDHVGGQP
jgi:hypothetical protein